MLNEWLSYLKEMLDCGSIYVRGAQGQFGDQITDKWIAQREYNDETQIKRVKATLQKRIDAGYDPSKIRAFDCSGLGMYFIQNIKKISSGDLPSYGMVNLCNKITRQEVTAGDFLFKTDDKGKINHVAYAIDKNNCIEARGRDYGVCLSAIDDRGFTIFGRPAFLKEEIEKRIEEENNTDGATEIVLALQRIRKELGIICDVLLDYLENK